MTNRDLAERAFNYMRSIKFKPYKIEYSNTYFLSQGGEDSIVHFRARGVNKHWKFGMWVNAENLDETAEEKYVIRLFAQWDRNIDKFKPSRSDLLVEINRDDLCSLYNDDDWTFLHVGDMLKMIKRHPLMCYAGFCGKHTGYYSRSFLWNFIDIEAYNIKKNCRKALYTAIFWPICKAKVIHANLHRCVDMCEIYNFTKRNKGWETSYLYGINCRFKADATDKEMSRVARIFKKGRYGCYDGYWDYVAELNCFTKVGEKDAFNIVFD